MDWIIGLVVLLAGIAVGYFIARQRLSKQSGASSSQQLEQALRQQLQAQTQEYMQQSRQTLQNIRQESDALLEKLANFEAGLHQENTSEQPQMNFYGDQASTYLRNKPVNDSVSTDDADYQPRDYPSQSSGLFSGAKNKQTAGQE